MAIERLVGEGVLEMPALTAGGAADPDLEGQLAELVAELSA